MPFLYRYDDYILIGLIVAGIVRFLVLPKSRIEDAIYELQHGKMRETAREEIVDDDYLVDKLREDKTSLASENKQKEEITIPLKEKKEEKKGSFENIQPTQEFEKDFAENYEEEIEPPKPKEPNFLQKFFAENALAKIGGILLFLGVLFLLQLVYTAIGPVGKLLIGFAIGFAVFGVGVFLDKKKLEKESRILLGTAILINYLVILSGRFLIGDSFTDNMLFSEGVTFLLLIFNTVFAVITSLVYKSHSLLFFSFVFAYLNPFLIGAEASDTPYTLSGYGMIVSLGAVVLSSLIKEESEKYSENLLGTAFLGGNLLFLIAPFETTTGWLVKLAMMAILSLVTFFTAYRNNQAHNLDKYFVSSYLFLMLLIGYGDSVLNEAFAGGFIVFSYSLHLILLIIAGIYIYTATAITSIFYILAAPFVILLWLIFGEILPFAMLTYVLIGTVIFYLGAFVYLLPKLAIRLQYGFFTILGTFILFISSFVFLRSMNTVTDTVILFPEALGITITTFLFLLSAYYFSTRKGLQYLYALGTVFSIFMLLPIIQSSGNLLTLSIVSIAGVTLLNIALPFINKELLESKAHNLVIGLVAGVLFSAGEIFYFGEMYFSGLTLGLAFLGQAILYFVLGFLMLQKMNVHLKNAENEIQEEHKESAKNVVYTLLGISVSLFSLAIAFVFSKNAEVVSAVWLFEATLMFFFYKKTEDFKVYFAGIILMAIGLFKLFVLIDVVQPKDFVALIPLSVIFGSLITNLKLLESSPMRFLHDIGHVIGAALIGILLLEIIPSTGHGWSTFGIAAFCLIPAFVYTYIYSGKIKYVFVGFLIFFFALQSNDLTGYYGVYARLERDNLEYLKVLQYLSSLFLAGSVWIYNKFLKKSADSAEDNLAMKSKLFLNAAFAIYLFVITTQYVYDIFANNEFVVTMYWGVIAFAFLSYGIQKNFIKFRTLGLYILTLTVGKILIYDIWSGLDDAVVRVIALMLVGVLMIVVSTLYSRKYDGNLKGEFDWRNLKE